jgi:hypothetical protein
MAAGRLTPEEGNSLITQLRTGIDPLRQKQEAQLTKQQAMQTQMMQAKMTQMKQAEINNQQLEAQLKEQGAGVYRITDPNTGASHLLIQNPTTGEWYNPLTKGGTAAKLSGRSCRTRTPRA